MRIAHIADIHSRPKDYDEVKKCLYFAGDRIEEERPDLIIHAGDAFDSRDIKLDSDAARLVFSFFSRMADIAPVAAVLGTNSHDGRAPEILSMVHGFHEIHVSSKPEQIYLMKGDHFIDELPEPPSEPKAVISLLPQPSKEWWSRSNGGSIAQGDMEISSALSAILAGFGGQAAQFRAPHLFVYHGTARGAKFCNGQSMIGREIEIGFDQIELVRCDIGMFGHIHLPQEPFPGIFYAGSVYAVDIGEAATAHGFWMHELKDGERESVFHVTPTKKISRIESDFTGNDDDPRDLDMVLYQLSPDEVKDASIRVELKVWQDQAAEFNKEKIREFYTTGGAQEVDVRIIRVPRETVRSAEVTKAHGLAEKITILARTRGEEVPEGVLELAADLESLPAETVLERVGGVA